MEPAITVLLILAALFGAALLWVRLRNDAVGRLDRRRRTQAGLQGQLDEWLYWEAPVGSPKMKHVLDPNLLPRQNPWLRAIQTLIRHETLRDNVEPEQAYRGLLDRTQRPLSLAFLRGRVNRAIHLHWRRQYRGPPSLFFLWLYGIAYLRYGRRHLVLDTLSAALQEFRTA